MLTKHVQGHPAQQTAIKVAAQITTWSAEGTQKKTAPNVGPATTTNNKSTKVQTQLKPEGGSLPEPQLEAPALTNQKYHC